LLARVGKYSKEHPLTREQQLRQNSRERARRNSPNPRGPYKTS
jgi:hypothetical protein